MRTDTHLYLICTLPEIVGLFFRPRPRQADEKQPQMLDAAHGERIGALAVVQRLHRPGVEPQVPCLLIAGKERRRSPVPTVRADVPQGSRRRVAVACSRRKRAITMRNAAKDAEQWFLYECRCVYFVRNVGRSLRGTLAGLRCGRLRPAQHCELQNRRTRRTGAKKPSDKTNNSLNPPRHYAASGLLNLHCRAGANHDPHHSGRKRPLRYREMK